jgi:hypothetical protein
MATPLKYSKYERPEGYTKGDPIVYVRKNVIKDIGMPVVNYQGLEELFYKDLGLSRERKVKAKLYGGSIGKRAMRAFCGQQVSPDWLLGFHAVYTNTLHVNASATERGGEKTMSVFVHEAKHLADSHQYRLARAIEMGVGIAILNAGIEVADASGFIPEVIGALAAREAWYAVQPAERRARAAQNSDLYYNHMNDIVFPSRR